MSFVSESDARSWPTSPAECQVEPCVSWYCSSSTESVQPSFARWFRTEHPPTPPPITTAPARPPTPHPPPPAATPPPPPPTGLDQSAESLRHLPAASWTGRGTRSRGPRRRRR